MSITPQKVIATIAVTVGLLGGGTAAYAYWSAGGAGSSSATTADVIAITVNQSAPITGLRAGDPPQALSGTFTNSNSTPVYVTAVTASITRVTKAAGAPAGTCDASDFTLVGAVMPVGAEIPAGGAVGSWSGATVGFNDKPDVNQDACQGATVTVAYAAS